ncbi:hypothetical protein HPULCUR_009696 [Helicostylum pulchrum]|uniref:Uncharacterized protein n=1 Tax=Helicostylum pulchrum TaxID=562976 RepID=A0ABP9YB65_9FUNG
MELKKLHYAYNRESLPGYITDYFDGESYKAFKAKNNFTSPDDVVIALYVDGFVTQKKSKQELVFVHVLVLNYGPSIRYTDQYMFQIAVIAGKVKDLDSYLLPIVDEVKSLGERGLIVKKHNGEIIKSKVHMIASGDISQGIGLILGVAYVQ